MFPLEVFPPGALSGSVITTVWVGVFVVAFFNLRFGWVLSGLVVPGYLAPLLLLKPWAVAVILLEGIVTYGLVWLFSERFSRFGLWSSLFGRDRFFGLILASILVRLTFDGWLLPEVGAWIEAHWAAGFDYRSNLHSFGLVIVALVANQFWKSGVLRGLPPLLIILGLTVLLVRYGLMELTNFGLGGLSYLYEDLAASILASPKAYIILVTTAFLASRMNLYYGWDFNGILIPALLALQWYDPLKILTSFGEAFIILAIASLLLRVPPFRGGTIEGARKLLLFFNVAFLYKMSLGWGLSAWAPTVKPTDLFAFGYLLSTLLAIRMHDKGIAIRLTRATLQTSLTAVVIASLIGFGLSQIDLSPLAAPQAAQSELLIEADDSRPTDRLLADKPALYQARSLAGAKPTPSQMRAFDAALMQLRVANPSATALATAAEQLASVGYRLERLDQRYLYLYEQPQQRGWGRFLIDTQRARDALLIEVPDPLASRDLLAASLRLFEALDGGALAIGGALSPDNVRDTASSLFQAFHNKIAEENVLALAVQRPAPAAAEGATAAPQQASQQAGQQASQLWVKQQLPLALSLPRLEQLSGALEVHWQPPPRPSRQWRSSVKGFVELELTPQAQRRLASAPQTSDRAQTDAEPKDALGPIPVQGTLSDWMLPRRALMAAQGTDAYQPPTAEQLIFLDDEVLTPLQRLITQGYRAGRWQTEAAAQLRSIAAAADVLGYALVELHDRRRGQRYLILAEMPSDAKRKRRHWGTYCFRLGPAEPLLIQVPRPLLEIKTLELGLLLFEELDARALLISDAHPEANQDLSADLIRGEQQRHLFNLVAEVLMRETSPQPQLNLQVRGMGQRPGEPLPEHDLLLAFADGANQPDQLSALGRSLQDQLSALGWSQSLVDVSRDQAGYQVGGLPQARYLAASENQDLALLWVSPLARTSVGNADEAISDSADFEVLGIKTRVVDLAQLLPPLMTPTDDAIPAAPALPAAIAKAVLDYLQTDNLLRLAALQHQWPELSIERILEPARQQPFLLLRWDGRPALVANLAPRQGDQTWSFSRAELTPRQLEAFITRGIALLEITP